MFNQAELGNEDDRRLELLKRSILIKVIVTLIIQFPKLLGIRTHILFTPWSSRLASLKIVRVLKPLGIKLLAS